MECREPFKWAGEVGLADSGWQTLVISKEDEVGSEGTHGSDKIFVAPQERACMRKSLPNVFEAHVFRFLRHSPFYAPDSSVAGHENKEFPPSRGFPQEKHMTRVKAVEGAANENAHHFFWRSMTYTLFSSRR